MRQIFIDSRDRVSGTTADFTIKLPETLTLPSGRRARVDNLRIPLTIPTIHDTNNTIQLQIGVTSYTISIPTGQYDGVGLASAIQGRLTATAPGAWTVVYDSANISMSILLEPIHDNGRELRRLDNESHPYTQTSSSYKFSYVSVFGIDMFYLSSQTFAKARTTP